MVSFEKCSWAWISNDAAFVASNFKLWCCNRDTILPYNNESQCNHNTVNSVFVNETYQGGFLLMLLDWFSQFKPASLDWKGEIIDRPVPKQVQAIIGLCILADWMGWSFDIGCGFVLPRERLVHQRMPTGSNKLAVFTLHDVEGEFSCGPSFHPFVRIAPRGGIQTITRRHPNVATREHFPPCDTECILANSSEHCAYWCNCNPIICTWIMHSFSEKLKDRW